MNDYTSLSNLPQFTMKSLTEAVAEVEARRAEYDNQVYRFDGSMDELLAALRAAGVMVLSPDEDGRRQTSEVNPFPPPFCPQPEYSPGALEVLEFQGSLFVGTPKALDRLVKGGYAISREEFQRFTPRNPEAKSDGDRTTFQDL